MGKNTLTNEELAEWIDQEGGVSSLIRHGLNGMTPRSMRTEILWRTCEVRFEAAHLAADTLMRHLNG